MIIMISSEIIWFITALIVTTITGFLIILRCEQLQKFIDNLEERIDIIENHLNFYFDEIQLIKGKIRK